MSACPCHRRYERWIAAEVVFGIRVYAFGVVGEELRAEVGMPQTDMAQHLELASYVA